MNRRARGEGGWRRPPEPASLADEVDRSGADPFGDDDDADPFGGGSLVVEGGGFGDEDGGPGSPDVAPA